MVSVLSINKAQAHIFKRMYSFDERDYKDLLEKSIDNAPTITDLKELRDVFIGQIEVYKAYARTLPLGANIGQYVHPLGDPRSDLYTGIEHVTVKENEHIEDLELPGRSVVEAMTAAYDAINSAIECLAHAITMVDQRVFRSQYGENARSPFREVELLREHITREQMDRMAEVLLSLDGTIDLHQFSKSDAALILHTIGTKMGIRVWKGLLVKVMHAKGIHDWYGGYNAEGKRGRDQFKSAAQSSTYKPSEKILELISRIKSSR